jgi:hypothetical protein
VASALLAEAEAEEEAEEEEAEVEAEVEEAPRAGEGAASREGAESSTEGGKRTRPLTLRLPLLLLKSLSMRRQRGGERCRGLSSALACMPAQLED